MNGRKLSMMDVKKLLSRFSKYKKGIPASMLGIKSWGVIDYANNHLSMNITIDYYT